MIDVEDVVVGVPSKTTTAQPKPSQPKKVKLEKEVPVAPPPIPDSAPIGVDTTRVNAKSQAFAAQSTAKFFVIATNIIAYLGKAEPIAMTDEEAIGIAIPLTTILLRIKAVRDAFEQYGQYFLSLDEYILLGVAIFAYYDRVEKELGRKRVTDESIKQAKSEQSVANTNSSHGYGGIAPIVTPAWRT